MANAARQWLGGEDGGSGGLVIDQVADVAPAVLELDQREQPGSEEGPEGTAQQRMVFQLSARMQLRLAI